MNQKCRDGSKKTMMFNLCQNRYKDDRRKSVTPAVIRLEVQIIITVRMKKHLTSIVSSSNNKRYRHYNNSLHKQNILPSVITISPIYSRRIEFYVPPYLLTYLYSSTDHYSMLINLSALTSEQKTRNKGYRDAIFRYVPDNNFS